MDNLSKELLDMIIETSSDEPVRINGKGKYIVTPNMAKALLEATGGDSEHVMYTNKVEFQKVVRGILGSGSLLQGMEKF